MKKLITSTFLILTVFAAEAQSIWSREHLDSVKANIDRPMYAAAYKTLISEADSLLAKAPLSVMMKEKASASGNKHDYTSLARYFHPNPDTPDGLPYVNRDGVTNPEIDKWDRKNLGDMAARTETLALAWYLSGNQRYADKAAEQLRVWFLDKETRMNPHFEYAQMVPGANNGKGRPYGVLDGYSFVGLLDAVALLENADAWSKKYDRRLKEWMGKMLDWLLTSAQGIEESQMANNHSTVYDVLTTAISIYIGRDDVAKKTIIQFPAKRIFTQIKPDGQQPNEMWRSLSFGYSQYNLSHMVDMFLMAQKLGIKIDNATDSENRSFYKAMDFLSSFLGKHREEWPGQQISGWDSKQQELTRDLWRISSRIAPQRRDYKELYHKHRIFDPESRFTILYYSPDEIDDAFTNAAASLRHAISRVTAERNKPKNAIAHKVNPRSADADGIVTLAHPHDWTSGFFPGELWMMYQFTNDPYWRQQAVSFTWDIEEAKTHRGTHDLGFMFGDSFGKAWEITGEKSYFDVLHQAAETLCTRFNPSVGAIRSWDHNADTWKYPVIIDNMMNLEMLFKMARETGDTRFHDIAVSHADVTLRNHFRSDHSSYHVVDYDPVDGKVRMKVTAQGHADDSYWSRGQGWGLYGYTMCYRFTNDSRYLAKAEAIADWFLSLPNMPKDMIPYWDMKAPGTEKGDNPNVARDASAASLIASSLYELAEYVVADKATSYRLTADLILKNLAHDYAFAPDDGDGFLLKHSTGHYPAGSEIDVPLIYADYYFLEALLRKRQYESK